MRKHAFLPVALFALVVAGCSSNDNGGTKPTPATRLVASAASAAPSLTNVDDTVWNAAAATTISMTRGKLSPPLTRGPINATAQSAPTDVTMKAITYLDTLYLRLSWSDPTFSVYPDVWRVDSLSSGLPLWVNDSLVSQEDQAVVMFVGLPGDTLDVWYWRVLTTTIRQLGSTTVSGFAEGNRLGGSSFLVDSATNNLSIALDNPPRLSFSQPTYVHKDSSLFNGFILYDVDKYSPFGFSNTWTVGQMVPGYIIDSSIATPAKAAARASRWDIYSAARWASGTNQYDLVLARPMNTGFTDDLDMSTMDSVKIKVGVTDGFDFDLLLGTQAQSFTGSFWLIL